MATTSDTWRTQGVQITGLRATVRRLEQFGVATQDLKGAFRKVSDVVVKKARQNVTTRAANPTGEAAGTVRAGNTKNKSVVRAGYARIGGHAGIDNYGGRRRRRRGKGWLNDAANDNPEQHVRTVETELDRLVTRVNR